MKKYFIVIENIDPNIQDACDWSYVSGWDPLTEVCLISDPAFWRRRSDIQSAVRDNDWKLDPGPFLFDTIEDVKNAIVLIKIHNHSRRNDRVLFKHIYHIVHAETVTITYPCMIYSVNQV